MRKAVILVNGVKAGIFEELDHTKYKFSYIHGYNGPPISLTLPLSDKEYEFEQFPAFFDGLLPEGTLLEALLRKAKLDQNDYFGQLLQVGHDVVGAVTIEELK